MLHGLGATEVEVAGELQDFYPAFEFSGFEHRAFGVGGEIDEMEAAIVVFLER